MGLKPGTVLFNRYVFQRCLYANASRGVLYCLDVGQKMLPVVVKIVYRQGDDGDFYHNLYKRECSFLRRISNPNVVSFHSFVSDECFSAFSMPYFSSGDLATLIENRETISIERAVCLFKQLCSGLSAIEASRIIHRDLKPENVLLGAEGVLKICDFDIAIDKQELSDIDKAVVGSADYVSPELVVNGRFDHRSDIYAIGLMAYELITGINPYRGVSPYESLVLRVRGEAHPPHTLRNDCPEGLSKAVLKSIARDPNERYEHVNRLWQDISVVPVKGSAAKKQMLAA